MGAGRAPSAGETSAVQTAAQRPVLHAEAPAAEETREGMFDSSLKHGGGFLGFFFTEAPPTLWLSTGGVSGPTFLSL